MKILFLAPLPYPVTGQAIASKRLLKHLELDNEVEILDLSKKRLVSGIDSFERIVQIVSILYKVFKKRNWADLIYLTISQSIPGNVRDLLIFAICKKSLSKMVVHLHGGDIDKRVFNRSILLSRLNAYFLGQIKWVVILGRSHVPVFENVVPSNKIRVVPNSTEDEVFLSSEDIRKKHSKTTALRILYMSNLIKEKGYMFLLDSFYDLDDTIQQRVIYDFAGGFDTRVEQREFEKIIENNQRIRFHGVVEGKIKRDLLQKAHALVLPTMLKEGQPISIIEAYAAGCVVITTATGGIKDIFKEDINGYRIEKSSVTSISRCIESKLFDSLRNVDIGLENNKMARERFSELHHLNTMTDIFSDVP